MSNQLPQNKKSSPIGIMGIFSAIVIVALGVYAISLGFFNGVDDSKEPNANLAGDVTQQCPVKEDLANGLKQAATGDIAAFRILDEPVNVALESFKDENGNRLNLGDWKGKTVLLNLWATWCAPCRAEMPHLEALKMEMAGPDFDLIAVNIDLEESEKPKRFLAEIGVENITYFADHSMDIFNNMKKSGLAFGLPVTVLIDKNSCAQGVLNGPANWASAEAKLLVKTAIDAK